MSTINVAIKTIKEKSKENFDASVELHINLDLNNQQVRYTTSLPHGTGKSLKVAVFGTSKVPNADLELQEADLAKIESGQLKVKVDFDILLAEPSMMPKLARVAKILGPAGVMPNPKSGTVAEDLKKAVDLVKKGKIEIKSEDAGIIHTVIGKVSFDDVKLIENYNEIMNSLSQNKPSKTKPNWIKSVYVCSTMGGSIMVDSLS